MPRKKPRNPLKRKKVEYDADPNTLINPKKKRKGKKNGGDSFDPDDEIGGKTPKEFQRLLSMAQNPGKNKKKDTPAETQRGRTKNTQKTKSAESTNTKSQPGPLKIMPGEKMAEFARRVDEAMPLPRARTGSPSRSDKKKAKKREKAAKAEAEAKKKAGSDDDEEEEEDEATRVLSKREPSPDPWAHLEVKKEKPKFGEVADRPPELNLPSKLLPNVPKSAGSMARREMLEEERKRFIEGYRKLMEQKQMRE